MAINFTKVAGTARVNNVCTVISDDCEGDEEVVKRVFQKLLAEPEGKVGLASKCEHQIRLKPGAKAIKQ